MRASDTFELPNEILNEICSRFCWHCQGCHDKRQSIGLTLTQRERLAEGTRNLATLRRTSKIFCAAATDHLFHTLFIHANHKQPVVTLLQTLITTPSFGQTARILILEPVYPDNEEISERDAALFEKAAATHHLTLPDGWHERDAVNNEYPRETGYVITQLLLLQLPNIEEMAITLTLHGLDILSDWVTTANSRPLFNALSSLSVEHWDTEGGFHMSNLSPILSLAPNLSALYGTRCASANPTLEIANVTNLSLTFSDLTGTDLESLIISCRELRSFTYCWDDMYEYGPVDDFPRPSAIVEALHSRHQRSLRTLALYFGHTEAWTSGGDLIGEMPAFDGLENLLLNVESFTQVDNQNGVPLLRTLPKTLKRACFINDLDRIHADLLWIARKIPSGSLPNLQEVGLNCNLVVSYGTTSRFTDLEQEVEEALVNVGVAFSPMLIWSSYNW
ncbi:hypothetical protein F5Y16DRAFT_370150 [Xylariaceae sp. FL0255]|nr:hypothetical protein F5Y16DRAFT_370150 [Xylariaceae sp. FL0255]